MGVSITNITYEELGGNKTSTSSTGITFKQRKVINSTNLGESSFRELYDFSREVAVKEALSSLVEEQTKYEFDKQPSVLVNGKYSYSTKLYQVEPLTGSIDFVARGTVSDAFLLAWDTMLRYARVQSGRYRDSLWLVKNRNNVIAKNRNDLEKWIQNSEGVKQRDVYTFVFTAPYSYMLELEGLSKGRAAKKLKKPKEGREGKTFTESDLKRVSNGAVVLSARALQRQLRGNVIVRPSVISGGEIGLTSPARGSGRGRIRQRGKNMGKPYVYPCVTIFIPADNALLQ